MEDLSKRRRALRSLFDRKKIGVGHQDKNASGQATCLWQKRTFTKAATGTNVNSTFLRFSLSRL